MPCTVYVHPVYTHCIYSTYVRTYALQTLQLRYVNVKHSVLWCHVRTPHIVTHSALLGSPLSASWALPELSPGRWTGDSWTLQSSLSHPPAHEYLHMWRSCDYTAHVYVRIYTYRYEGYDWETAKCMLVMWLSVIRGFSSDNLVSHVIIRWWHVIIRSAWQVYIRTYVCGPTSART